MKAMVLVVLAFSAAVFAAEGGKRMETKQKTAVQMVLTSPSFKEGAAIPKIYTGEGKDVSPALQWSGTPQGTQSFALIMDDPDAPPGTWVHWVLYDIPGGSKGLPEDLPKKETVLGAAKHGACWGVKTFDRVGYYGPMPPPGAPHHYHFKLYALDEELGLKPRTTKDQVAKAMEGHVLAEAELIGIYQR